MTPFEKALAQNPAPQRLGDVVLRFEPSMLIGETRRSAGTLWPSALWVVGLGSGLMAVYVLAVRAPLEWPVTLGVVSALGFLLGALLERLEARRRAFVANFATTRLRLDFVTPLRGQPKTLIVHFDAVRGVELEEQGDGRHCLTVDFVISADRVYREVLAASIGEEALPDAHRFKRVLEGAFGLGEPPDDSPWREDDAGLGEPRSVD